MLKISLEKRALKALGSFTGKDERRISKKIMALRENPQAPNTCLLKNSSWRRAKCGGYRIIYRVEEGILRVLLIGKRNDDEIYRVLMRIKDKGE